MFPAREIFSQPFNRRNSLRIQHSEGAEGELRPFEFYPALFPGHLASTTRGLLWEPETRKRDFKIRHSPSVDLTLERRGRKCGYASRFATVPPLAVDDVGSRRLRRIGADVLSTAL